MSEPNYLSTKAFHWKLLAIEIRIRQIFINKSVYLGLSILESNKTVTYEFWYDYVKPKYGEKAKLGYIDPDDKKINIKMDDI